MASQVAMGPSASPCEVRNRPTRIDLTRAHPAYLIGSRVLYRRVPWQFKELQGAYSEDEARLLTGRRPRWPNRPACPLRSFGSPGPLAIRAIPPRRLPQLHR